jgi:predicted transposase YbfD/YdcC
MPVSHAPETAVTSENRDEKKALGLLEILAQVPDLRKRRGRRYELVFVLAVAACCALAGAKTYREIGDQAADLPQDVLARLGGRIHPLKRAITAPSEKRIRTLIQAIDAGRLDQIIGGWLRALAQAGKLEPLLTAIAIDGKWLRGIADGTEKLFAAMLHDGKVIIGQHRIPEGTNEITQVKELLDAIDLVNCVVTADAAHAQRDTAGYIAGPAEDGGRAADYAVTVKGNQPGLQRGIYDKVTADCPAEPAHVELDCSHGRIVKRSIWVTGAEGIDFPHADQVYRIRRDTYDITGTALAKEIVHGITSLDAERGTPGVLARITRGQWGIESVHWLRDTAWREDQNTGYAGNGPQVMASLRNIAVSLLHIAGVTEILRTLQAICRDRTRILDYLPL